MLSAIKNQKIQHNDKSVNKMIEIRSAIINNTCIANL